jgi:hypothetical protein
MKLITRFQLASRNLNELYALRRTTFNALVRTGRGTTARRTGLATLENIERELAARHYSPAPYPFICRAAAIPPGLPN